jgi:hypothetical protein
VGAGVVFTTETRRTRRNTEKGVKQSVGFKCGCGCGFYHGGTEDTEEHGERGKTECGI